jgi:hypothetical protein
MTMPTLRGLLCVASILVAGSPALAADLRSQFAEPPLETKSRPLWFWNGPLTKAGIEEQIERCKKESGYYGFGILPSQGMTPAYASPEFLDRYGEALDKAAALGMKMCLYDEYWFPSGSAGGMLAQKYPNDTAKRLDLVEEEVAGPKALRKRVPPGTLMAAVAMHAQTKERIDLASRIASGELNWNVPAGTWRVMLFVCVRDGWDHVDYLNPASVARFIELTYQRFYDRFPKHFGTTIDSAFYDEPTFWTVQGGRMWTEGFNREFRAARGFDPAPYYPALWHDIGPETEAARAALFGFRAELFSKGFAKTINDWCRAHKIHLTGHVDQEEIVNPTGLCGDLMKSFEHQDIPGVDEIFQYGRASKAYKIVSSAAYNYDRELVMTETYGAMEKLQPAGLYKEAMDQYAKGINFMVPHAVWYEPAKIIFPPELSYRNPLWGPQLPAYNQYVGRLNLLLQSGTHVADIAVVYPIAGLQAAYHFDSSNPYLGGPSPKEADYMDVGEQLSTELRRDFTFLHPEVLQKKCEVRGDTLVLNNALHPETYRVVILPGCETVHVATMARLRAFYEQGGKVICTTRAPSKSVEFGQDAKVREAVRAMFGKEPGPGQVALSQTPLNGGYACFIANPKVDLRAVIDGAMKRVARKAYDVTIGDVPPLAGGNLSYLHKVRDGRNLYFFANSSDSAVDTEVRLRGRLDLEAWDPHTGQIRPLSAVHEAEGSEPVTRVRLVLPAVRSVFLLEKGR